jgi:hypothetical protein
VWVLLPEGLSARRQLLLTQALVRRYRSLDTSPLENPTTGCVRYPGSPHRHGGHSRIIELGVPSDARHAAVLSGECRAPADIDARIIDALTHPRPDQKCRRRNDPHTVHRITQPAMLYNAIRSASARIRANRHTPLPALDDPHLPPAPPPADHLLPQILPLTTPPAATHSPAAGTGLIAAGRRALDVHILAALHYRERVAGRRTTGSRTTCTQPLRVSACAAPRIPAPTSTDPATVPAGTEQWAEQWAEQWTAHDLSRATTLGLGELIDALHPHTRRLLNPANPTLPTHIDASAIMFTALLGAAKAGWRHHDIDLLAVHFSPPAFTHAASQRTTTGRRTRPPRTASSILRRQFDKACAVANREGGLASTRGAADSHHHELTTLAVHVLATADQLGITHSRTQHMLRRVLETMLSRAMIASTPNFYAGVRDVAHDCGIASPQTAATKIRTLIRLGFLTITTPAQGRRANQYQLTVPDLPQHPDWTQGLTAPHTTYWARTFSGKRTTEIGELLAMRTRHFRHDVWTAMGDLVALTAFHYAHQSSHNVCDIADNSDRSTRAVAADLTQLKALNLIDQHGTPQLTHHHYVAAAHATGTAGIWHQRRVRSMVEHHTWDWWCAENEFLAAPRQSKRRVVDDTALKDRGRYPRLPALPDQPALPDHAQARAIITAELQPATWRAQ